MLIVELFPAAANALRFVSLRACNEAELSLVVSITGGGATIGGGADGAFGLGKHIFAIMPPFKNLSLRQQQSKEFK